MKKNTLLQLIIIFFGLSAIYVAIFFVIENLYRLLTGTSERYNSIIIEYLVTYTIIGVLGFLAIVKSGNIAAAVATRAGMDDSLTIYTRPKQLLSILIVVTAISHLLDRLPGFVHNLLGIFTNTPAFSGNDSDRSPNWLLSFFQILLPCLVIIFSKNLTNYFAKNIMQDDDDLIVEHETVDIGEDGLQENE